MAQPEDDPSLVNYLTAHHEAGHAVAALRRKRAVYEMYVVFPDGFTRHEKLDADYAFVLYAGPWAQARADRAHRGFLRRCFLWPGRCFARHVAIMFGHNYDDWRAYEEEMDGNVDVVLAYDLAKTRAYHEQGMRRYDIPATITPPNKEWDRELAKVWPEIQKLATQILAADEHEQAITLSDGTTLDSLTSMHWLRQDAPTAAGTITGVPPEPTTST